MQSLTLADGTDPGQADSAYGATLSLAGAPEDLDLSSGGLLDCFGDAVDLTSVAAVVIVNRSTVTGESLTIGAAAVNPWTGFLGTTTSTVVIAPGGFLAWQPGTVDVVPVSAGTADVLRLDPGAATFDVDIIIIGRS